MRTAASVGVVGLEARGRRLAAVLTDLPQAELRWLCDRDPDVLARVSLSQPGVATTDAIDEMLADESLDAVVIATPPATRYATAVRALEAEKHVYVDEPLALSAAHADDLVLRADRLGRCLMVGHLGLFHPAVLKLRELLELGHLGDVYYVYANWQALGEVRGDETALWQLGVPDVAVILHLLGDEPVSSVAHGEAYIQPGVADVAFCFLKFATGICAHLHLSWLDPHQLHRLTVVGSRRMAVVDYAEPERTLTVHEKRATRRVSDRLGAYVETDVGDIVSPRISGTDPCRAACEAFLSSFHLGTAGPAGAAQGARVVAVLESLERSLEESTSAEPVAAPRLRAMPTPALG